MHVLFHNVANTNSLALDRNSKVVDLHTNHILSIAQLGISFNRFSRLKFRDRDLSVSTPRVLLPPISCSETITTLSETVRLPEH